MATSLQGIVTGLEDLALGNRTDTTEEASRKPGGDLGKDEFLQLLVCQMKNQDPLEPAKDTDFIAQLAQFSALEQMQNLNGVAENSQAFGLVGKTVVINNVSPNGSITEVSGVVDYVTIKNGKAKLSVNGNLYDMENLYEVKDSYYAIMEFLPSVEKTEAVYDKSNRGPVQIDINLGEGNYAANSVAVLINGEYVNKDNLTYEDGKLRIWPAALDGLEVGKKYTVELVFDDPYQTVISDKVTIQVTESGKGSENGETSGDTDKENEGGEEKTEGAETDS